MRTRVYIAQRSPPVLGSEDRQGKRTRQGTSKGHSPEDNQHPPGEPIPAQLRNGNLFASLDDNNPNPVEARDLRACSTALSEVPTAKL